MESPLVIALSRQITAREHMSVLANNIANMNTTGYKAERLVFKELIARTQDGDRVHFPEKSTIHRDLRTGAISRTGNSLDVALRGRGYLTVRTPQGDQYTRNGHFSINAQKQLSTPLGHPVIGDGGEPITFDGNITDIKIAPDGSIKNGDAEIGKLKLVTFENHQLLKRSGESLFRTKAEPQPADDIEVLQGFLEGSNVVPILEMTRFMKAVGFHQSAKKIIDTEDERQRMAIDRLGKAPE